MKLSEVAKFLDGTLVGPAEIEISKPAKIEEAGEGDITFISNPKYKHFLETTKASAVVVDKSVDKLKIPHIKVENAYMGFLLLLKLFEPKRALDLQGINKSSAINDSAEIGEGTVIGPLVYIGSDCKIGKNCKIYPGVVILENVTIGEECIFYPNVSIREDSIIGRRVILQDGVVIGGDGFGFAPQNGIYHKIPQIGNVIIEDDVEIGANTTIDRATVGSTVIKKGTKLDNLIMIAHNCSVGENTVIAAQSGVAGSTNIGSNITIGGQVGINGHIQIGDGSIIAAQSGVTKNVEANSIIMGLPAIPITENKRINVSIRNLPSNIKRISVLEKELDELKKILIADKTGNK